MSKNKGIKMEIEITLALLRQGRMASVMAILMLILTIVMLLFLKYDPLFLVLALLLGSGSFYYAVRVSLDYQLFLIILRGKGQGDSEASLLMALDRVLQKSHLIKETASLRPLESRFKGAILLLKKQFIFLILQLLGLLGVIVSSLF